MAGIIGKAARSYKKATSINNEFPALGFKRFLFAFQNGAVAIGANVTITFASVINAVPAEMVGNGFNQPTLGQVQNSQFGSFRDNVVVTSNLNGVLQDYITYAITDTGITFLNSYSLEAGEIITISRGQEAVTGNRVVSARPLRQSGDVDFSTLATSPVDFPVPEGFRIAPSTVTIGGADERQIGYVQVYVDGLLQFRNAGNGDEDATTVSSQTGNYRELFVDSDGNESSGVGGIANRIRFNIGQPFSATESVMVISTNLIVDDPNNTSVVDQVTVLGPIARRREVFNSQVTGDFSTLSIPAIGAAASPSSDVLSIAMDQATEPYIINSFVVTITNEYGVTPTGTLTLLLQSKVDGIGDTGWITIGTATSVAGATPSVSALVSTSIPTGTFLRLRPTSFGATQPSFHVTVNGTVTA